MGKLEDKILHLPVFLISCFVLYWSLPVGVFLNYIKVFQFQGLRNDMYTWASGLKAVFGIKIVKLGEEKLYKPEKGKNVLYLCNHRSWADFFCDVYLTQGNAALLSRMLVYYVFPFFMTSVVILKGVVLFKRGKIDDKDAFNKMLDGKLAGSPIPGLLVYPEGTRSLKEESLPLKRGMLYYAHSRNISVQIVMSSGKEYVLSEKQMQARLGRTIVSSLSPAISPSDYPDVTAFLDAVQSTWDALWVKVYNADVDALPELKVEDAVSHEYTDAMRQQQLGVAILSTFIMTLQLLFSWWLMDKVFGLLGAYVKVALYVLFVTWVIASIVDSLMGPRHEPHTQILAKPASKPAPDDKPVAEAVSAAAGAANDAATAAAKAANDAVEKAQS